MLEIHELIKESDEQGLKRKYVLNTFSKRWQRYRDSWLTFGTRER